MLSNKEQKLIKSLKVKKYRTREKRFLIEGAKNVEELLDSDFQIDVVVGTEAYLFKRLDRRDVRFEVVDPGLLSELGTFKTNDTALAVAAMKDPMLDAFDDTATTFVLDGVSDPGNVGTIIRTLDWFGFDQLVCSPECADFYHPKVINSTMGSFTRMKYHSLSLDYFFSRNELPVVGADINGENLFQSNLVSPAVIVMGSESHGFSEEVKASIHRYVTIPKFGKAESLNVGIATGIIAGYLRMS